MPGGILCLLFFRQRKHQAFQRRILAQRTGIPVKIRVKDGIRVVSSADIRYIEVMGHDLMFHMESEIISAYGPDSLIGRTAAVMLGSTETTFYTVAVYFGAAGVTRTRYAVPAALCADLVGFAAAAFAVRLFFGG